MALIHRDVYLTKDVRTEIIKLTQDSQIGIELEFQDYTIPAGATIKAYATTREAGGETYEATCSWSNNKVTLTPPAGFFVNGNNLLQIEVNGSIIPVALNVRCEPRVSDGQPGTTPESIRSMVSRAEEAAGTAEAAASETETALSIVSEPTRNINTSGIAKKYVKENGALANAPGGSYLGLGGFVKCESETTYTIRFDGVQFSSETPKTGYDFFVGCKIDDTESPFVRSKTFKYSDTLTFTTPADAYEMYVDIYRSSGITLIDGTSLSDDSALNSITCQIEKGTTATEYIPYVSAVDYVARNSINEDLAVPPYYRNNVKDACADASAKLAQVGLNNNYRDGIQFIYFSDVHWGENAKHSPALIKYAKDHTAAKLVVCCGDVLTRSNEKQEMIDMALEWADSFRPVSPIEFTFGNHDRNQNGNSDHQDRYLSDEEVYGTLFSLSSDTAKWTGYFNYYVDDEQSNTRTVFVTQFYGGEQYTLQENWIKSVAAASQSMNLVYFIHSTKTGEASHLPTIKSMHDQYGNVRAVFSGHRHYDAVESYQSDVEGRSILPIISIDADCMTRLKNADGTNRDDAAPGTVDEQCIDIVTMKYSTNTIDCSRIGRGNSRHIVGGQLST